MALKVPPPKAAEIAIGSIGCGYDIGMDLRLKYCKGDSKDSCLIEIDEDGGRDIALPGGILIRNVSKSIKCDKGECIRFRSDVLSFQQMSEHFNQEISLTGKIPSGLFNSMFEFSGCWQKDAANTKTLAFDGSFITLYSVALEKSQVVLRDHVKKAVPSTWEPAALARFIETYGTHIIVGVKMGGKDVIYIKQQQSSNLQPADIQERLKDMADKRFLDANGPYSMASEQVFQSDKDFISIYTRRGGRDNRNLSHNDWLQTVQSEPDVISMSFIPFTSLLNGVCHSGYLAHAINLYLRYKPSIEQLREFFEFQLPRQWAPVFGDLALGLQRKRQSTASLQFSFMGPKLFVNTTPVNVGNRPVTGLRFNLEGKRSNRLAVCVQHLSSLPTYFQLVDEPDATLPQESYDKRYFEKVKWKNFSRVYTAPVESCNDHSIVTGALLQVEKYGFKKNVLFLQLHFSTVLGAITVRHSEWDGSFGIAPQSAVLSVPSSSSPVTSASPQTKTYIGSAVYPGGPPMPNYTPKLLKYVDTAEMTRGPQDPPGYWVVSGARLVVEKGKIALRVKYSLLTAT